MAKKPDTCPMTSNVLTTALRGPSSDTIEAFSAAMSAFWHPVLRCEQLPAGGLVGVTLLGRPIALARLETGLTALLDVCRHFQAQLSLGSVTHVNGVPAIQCPYHGWAYDQSGVCIRIPQLPPSRAIPRQAAVPSFQIVEHLGLIWVCLSSEPRTPLPDFPEFNDERFRITSIDEEEPTAAASIRMIMATLDDTHFPWVHPGILGDPSCPEPPTHTVTRSATELQVSYSVQQPASLASGATGTSGSVTVDYLNIVSMPGVIRLRKTTPGGAYVVWLATCPVDYNVTQNFWMFARDYDLDPVRDEEYAKFSAHVRAQDKPIVESQRPWLLPELSSGIEFPMAPADLPLIEYQRWLQELGIVTAV